MGNFQFSNIFGDPFAVVTLSIAIIGWVLALVPAIIAEVHRSIKNYTWWGVALNFVVIIAIIIVVGYNNAHLYGIGLVGYVSSAFTVSTLAVNNMIYSDRTTEQASAAGFILLSAINAVWAFYFGSAPFSDFRRSIDAHASKPQPMYGSKTPPTLAGANANRGSPNQGSIGMSSRFTQQPPHFTTTTRSLQSQQNVPGAAYPIDAPAPDPHLSIDVGPQPQPQPQGQGQQQQRVVSGLVPPRTPAGMTNTGTAGNTASQLSQEVSTPTEYPFRAEAVYSYDADPEDSNEISFAKGEVLEVSDVGDRWWQARKGNGATGIAPSNYLRLL